MARLSSLMILICCIVSVANAQDSSKKFKPAKPYARPAAYPAAVKPAYQQPVYARQDTGTIPKDQSLSGQYKYLLTKVYHYQQPLIAALWKNASDTLNLNKHKLKDAQAKLGIQNKAIDSLKVTLTNTGQTLSEANAKRDTISLAGVPVTKSAYNMIMWGLVVVFGITAAIVIARSGIHSREANYRTKLYSDLEEDYKNFKAKANEKEKKLARELQTERNKLDDLLGNS